MAPRSPPRSHPPTPPPPTPPHPFPPAQDFRYMALSDLAADLDKGPAATLVLNEGTEGTLAGAVVERLADASADVRAQAVKW